MKRIVSALVLAAVFATSRARAADPDPWLGQDKALHFGVSTAIAVTGYVVGAAIFDARRDAILTGAALTAAAGIGKETLDLAGYGDPSWKDLAWDGVGMVAGLALAWGVDLAIRGVSDARPLFVAPSVRSESASLGVRFAF